MAALPTQDLRFTAAELAAKVGGELLGPGGIGITNLDTVADAGPSTLTFVGDLAHARALAGSRAGAAVVTRTLAKEVAAGDARAIAARSSSSTTPTGR